MSHSCCKCGAEAVGYRNRRWWCRRHAPQVLLDALKRRDEKARQTEKQMRTKEAMGDG